MKKRKVENVNDMFEKLKYVVISDENKQELLEKIIFNLLWCDEILLKELIEKWCA